MTAWNIVAQRDAAYLLHDTALYDAEGVILGFVPKVLFLTKAISNPAAMAMTGCVTPAEIAQFVERLDLRGGCELVQALPKILAECTRLALAKGRRPGLDSYVALAVATFDNRTGRATGHVVANGWSLYPRKIGYVPGTVIGGARGYHFCTDHCDLFGPGTDPSDPVCFNPLHDGASVLRYQREHCPTTFGNNRASIVGGAGVVTKVSLVGVESSVVCEWPDKVGDRIAA